jgi:hypothetical protein
VRSEDGWRCLADALAARATAPPLLPRQPWEDEVAASLVPLISHPGQPLTLRLAAAVITDRPAEAVELPAVTADELHWKAVALRRGGRFAEARRGFRVLGDRPIYPQLFERAQSALGFGAVGFRWAASAFALLRARGSWDPVWFVDACAAAEEGVLSRETAALLEAIQQAELELLLLAGAAG